MDPDPDPVPLLALEDGAEEVTFAEVEVDLAEVEVAFAEVEVALAEVEVDLTAEDITLAEVEVDLAEVAFADEVLLTEDGFTALICPMAEEETTGAMEELTLWL